jgi:hypothetical protein
MYRRLRRRRRNALRAQSVKQGSQHSKYCLLNLFWLNGRQSSPSELTGASKLLNKSGKSGPPALFAERSEVSRRRGAAMVLQGTQEPESCRSRVCAQKIDVPLTFAASGDLASH